MEKRIIPGLLQGEIAAPTSKSALHRALICAALSQGETVIDCPVPAEDIRATAQCLSALGAGIEFCGGKYYANHIERRSHAVLPCRESGSTLRFLLPLAAALGTETEFLCEGSLSKRPLGGLKEALELHGCRFSETDRGYHLGGQLLPGEFLVDGRESSQPLSGFLMALPVLGESTALAELPIASYHYVNLTEQILREFGVEITEENGRFFASGRYCSPGEYHPEGDWSAAANWLVADGLGSRVKVTNLSENSAQPDRAVRKWMQVIAEGHAQVDASECPDLVPCLGVYAALHGGETRFVHAARLRKKESDRLAAVSAMLCGLGGDCRETPDGLVIHSVPHLTGGIAESFGDHRIAMAAAAAATVCADEVVIRGAECVAKSYPAFWSDFEKLGGKAE